MKVKDLIDSVEPSVSILITPYGEIDPAIVATSNSLKYGISDLVLDQEIDFLDIEYGTGELVVYLKVDINVLEGGKDYED